MKKLILSAIMAAFTLTVSAQSLEVINAFEQLVNDNRYLCGSVGGICKVDSIKNDTLYKGETITYFFNVRHKRDFESYLNTFLKVEKEKNCLNLCQMSAGKGEEFAWDGEKLIVQKNLNAKEPTALAVATIKGTDKMPRRVLLIHYTMCDDGSVKGMTVDYKYSIINNKNKKLTFPYGCEAEGFCQSLAFWRNYEKMVIDAVTKKATQQQQKREEEIEDGSASETQTILRTFNKLQNIVYKEAFMDKRTDAALSIYLLVKDKKDKLDDNEKKFLKSQIGKMVANFTEIAGKSPDFSTILDYLIMAGELL